MTEQAETPLDIPNSSYDAAILAVTALTDRSDPFEVTEAPLRAIADRTTFHQHRIAKTQAEAAVEIVAAQRAEARRIDQILGRAAHDGRERVVNSIDLGGGTWIVEVAGGPFDGRVPFTVIHDSKASHTYFTSLDEALLYAIELRNGGRDGDRGYVFAARALGVKTAYDA